MVVFPQKPIAYRKIRIEAKCSPSTESENQVLAGIRQGATKKAAFHFGKFNAVDENGVLCTVEESLILDRSEKVWVVDCDYAHPNGIYCAKLPERHKDIERLTSGFSVEPWHLIAYDQSEEHIAEVNERSRKLIIFDNARKVFSFQDTVPELRSPPTHA